MSSQPVSNLPFWGQAWELTVTNATATGSTKTTVSCVDWSTEGLRLTFDVLQGLKALWYADISIYNLNDPTVQTILYNATWVTLKAGFQTGPNKYATIWDGPVFQVLYTREGVVDQFITFHCLATKLGDIEKSIVSFATGKYSSQLQLVARMAAEVGLPALSYEAGTVGPLAAARMTAIQYPRGNTVFGKINKYLEQVADSNFMQTYHDGQKAYITEVGGSNPTKIPTPDLIYSPPFPPGYTSTMLGLPANTTQSILGTPQATAQGANFTVLLDPRLKMQLPPLVVQLARTQIAQLFLTPQPDSGGTNSPPALNANLLFFVTQVRHTGDTRGNTWATEVTGWTTAYAENIINFINADQ
jgi:hypothetical protein